MLSSILFILLCHIPFYSLDAAHAATSTNFIHHQSFHSTLYSSHSFHLDFSQRCILLLISFSLISVFLIVLAAVSQKYIQSSHLSYQNTYPISTTNGFEDFITITHFLHHAIQDKNNQIQHSQQSSLSSQNRILQWYEIDRPLHQSYSDVKLTFGTDLPQVYLKMLIDSNTKSNQQLCTCPCGHITSELQSIPHISHYPQSSTLQNSDSNTSFGDDASLSSFSFSNYKSIHQDDTDDSNYSTSPDSDDDRKTNPISEISTNESNKVTTNSSTTSVPVVDLECGSQSTNSMCHQENETKVPMESLDWSAFGAALSLFTRITNVYKKSPAFPQSLLPY